MRPKDFFQKKVWKKWDKSQWTILILTGILLMVVAIPTEERKENESKIQENQEQQIQELTSQKDYARELEVKLKDTLSKINGVGQVEVMITLEDMGESVVEKDQTNETSDLQETDSTGGVRREQNVQTTRATVYGEEGDQKSPFVGKEMMPKVSGVLVVAQGGENTVVKQNISEAVMALFQIDVNRIKVVKMNIQEEGY